MADVNFMTLSSFTSPSLTKTDAARLAGSRDAAETSEGIPPYDLIELLFFAYRDFTADPDTVLPVVRELAQSNVTPTPLGTRTVEVPLA